jgi:hypothetical protein
VARDLGCRSIRVNWRGEEKDTESTPAKLQAFLERGFDTFKAMGGARDFLDMIAERERDLAARLFAGEDVAIATALQADGAVD